MIEYPEHEKLKKVKDKAEAIGEFIDGSGYTLCKVMYSAPFNGPGGLSYEPTRNDQSGHYVAEGKSIERILAEWFDIDYAKLEQEKRQMLADLRAA